MKFVRCALGGGNEWVSLHKGMDEPDDDDMRGMPYFREYDYRAIQGSVVAGYIDSDCQEHAIMCVWE